MLLTALTQKAGFTFGAAPRSCSKDRFVVAESLVLRMKFSRKNPALRAAAKGYRSW